MAKKPTPPIKDDVGRDWQARADAAWAAALKASDGDAQAALTLFTRRVERDASGSPRDAKEDASTLEPVLPDFDGMKHPSVARPAFGRFLEDRDAGIVHDVSVFKPTCRVDRIANGTFYHFGHEVPDDLTRHDCIEVEANA